MPEAEVGVPSSVVVPAEQVALAAAATGPVGTTDQTELPIPEEEEEEEAPERLAVPAAPALSS